MMILLQQVTEGQPEANQKRLPKSPKLPKIAGILKTKNPTADRA
jgi:hypothetical protein